MQQRIGRYALFLASVPTILATCGAKGACFTVDTFSTNSQQELKLVMWDDLNNNGRKEDNEPLLDGVQVDVSIFNKAGSQHCILPPNNCVLRLPVEQGVVQGTYATHPLGVSYLRANDVSGGGKLNRNETIRVTAPSDQKNHGIRNVCVDLSAEGRAVLDEQANLRVTSFPNPAQLPPGEVLNSRHARTFRTLYSAVVYTDTIRKLRNRLAGGPLVDLRPCSDFPPEGAPSSPKRITVRMYGLCENGVTSDGRQCSNGSGGHWGFTRSSEIVYGSHAISDGLAGVLLRDIVGLMPSANPLVFGTGLRFFYDLRAGSPLLASNDPSGLWGSPPSGGVWAKRGSWLEETRLLSNAITRVAAHEVGHGMGLVRTKRASDTVISYLDGSSTYPNHNDTTSDLNNPVDGNPVVRVRGQPHYVMFPAAASSVSGATTFGVRAVASPTGGQAVVSGGPTAEFLNSNQEYMRAVHH